MKNTKHAKQNAKMLKKLKKINPDIKKVINLSDEDKKKLDSDEFNGSLQMVIDNYTGIAKWQLVHMQLPEDTIEINNNPFEKYNF